MGTNKISLKILPLKYFWISSIFPKLWSKVKCIVFLYNDCRMIFSKITETNWTSHQLTCSALHHNQSSLYYAQSWTLSVIDRQWSSVDCWQHLATIEGITLISGDIKISYLFDKYSPDRGGFVTYTRSGSSGGRTLDPMQWLKVPRMQWLYKPTALK